MITLTTDQAQQIEEAFENAESVAASINAGKHHVIQIDDEKCFWQREEWVRWAIDEVLPEIREALSAIRDALAEQDKHEPVYAFRRRGLDDFCTCTKERYDELVDKPNLFEVTTFYTTPPTAALAARQMRDSVFTALLAAETPYTQMTMMQKKVFGDAIATMPIPGEEK